MAYNNLLSIAYIIKVGSTAGPTAKSYSGDSSVDKDIQKRCSIMKNAIQDAYQKASKIDGGKSVDTLKLFMAPEFYFRNLSGAYPIEKISLILENLRGETKNVKYAHWLFVLGSAIGYLEHGSDVEVFNIALIQKGGFANADGTNDRIVYKEYVSHIDFVRDSKKEWNKALGMGRKIIIAGHERFVAPTEGSRDLRSRKSQGGSEIQTSAYGGASIFTLDQINFGLEVCLDHAKGRLANFSIPSGQFLIQVQLIPSAGMEIVPKNVACCDGGIIFNVDGLSPHAAMKKKVGSALQNIAAVGSDTNIALKGIDYLAITHSKYFENHGVIRVYKKTPIPAPKRKA